MNISIEPQSRRLQSFGSRRPTLDLQIAIARHSPTRPTDWRWRLAKHFDSSSRVPKCRDDALADAICLRRALLGSQARRQQRQPSESIQAAHAIYGRAGALRTEIEARLLAGQPLDQIPYRENVPLVTIARFEAVFFNVVDRLRARDYLAMLLRRGTRDADGRLDVATVIKTVAFTSGLAALELLLRDVLDDTGNLKPFGSFDWATKQGRDCARLRLLCAAIQLPDTLAIACELEHCHKALLEADNSMVPCAEESGAIEQAVDQALIQALHDIANTKAVGAEQSALFNVRADRVVA